MKALLNRRYAPATDAWGFLQTDFATAADFFTGWLKEIRGLVARPMEGTLDEALTELGTDKQLRVLLAATRSEWVAVFLDRKDNYHSEVAHPARAIPCRRLHVMCVENTYDAQTKSGEFGAVVFQTLERTVHAGYYDNGWKFGADGPVLPFEETENYKARRVRDRFTPEMLERYARAMGIELFDENFYGPRFVLFAK